MKVRQLVGGDRLQIAFSFDGEQCRELLPAGPINKTSIQRAASLRDEIRRKIAEGAFDYGVYFPNSPRAKKPPANSQRMEMLLDRQLEIYRHQMKNGVMSPSTFRGYEKAIKGERMKRWHGMEAWEATPSLLREWIGEMRCTSKAIRNLLTPLRSLFEDALNDGAIEFNPFDRIALAKLIRQTARASDYEVRPFTAAERAQLLGACRADEWPTLLFWFSSGLRPGELQALDWDDSAPDQRIVKISRNQVAGIIKAPKTAAGIRDVDLNDDAIRALEAQRLISGSRGKRVFLNPRTGEPWETDAQLRKTFWLPICARSGVDYRNPYQIRHTFASTLLTAGHNPWYVAGQLGHEDVQLVFTTYGKFIREDYQKPKPTLRMVDTAGQRTG
ncbi:site-specific integrase [Paracidovorax avenae]|uniref:site-specific integrase n=1 Tax=Paracidovorax avenae TaxID=80867 RepID=UPI001CEFA748|nr:site-specific integrase [Paracidovorax avenae]